MEARAQGKAAEWIDPSTLIPWKGNPRKNDHAVAEVARSIEKYGFGAPIVARLKDRSVIAGHTRLKAAVSLGLEMVPVRFIDVTEKQARELALVDNRTGELADWDENLLLELEQELDLLDLGWYESLMRERNALVQRKFGGGLTRKESCRLAMVRWELECIEDARIGPDLDKLESLIELQESMAKQVNGFLQAAHGMSAERDRYSAAKSRRPRRGR